MKVKKQIISIIYLFIIFASYCLSNICKNIIILKSEYDLSKIKNHFVQATMLKEINGKIIQAFSYEYLDIFEYRVKIDLINIYNEIEKIKK